MKHPNDTRVRFVPDPRRDQPQESHSGKVIYYTTDCFYRVQWDDTKEDPNPQPDFLNSHRVFRPEQIAELERKAHLRLDLILDLPNPPTADEITEAVSQYLGEQDISGSFDVVEIFEQND